MIDILELFLAEDPANDRLCLDGCVLGNITHFEAWCAIGHPLYTRYDVVGAIPQVKENFVELQNPTPDTHPLILRFGTLADDLIVKYRGDIVPLLTEVSVYQQASPRKRLIRITALRMDAEILHGMTKLEGVEVIVDHEKLREFTNKVETSVNK